MTNGAKLALGTTGFAALLIGGELLYLHHRNVRDQETPVASAGPVYNEPKLSDDDAVFIRKQRPDSLKDERALIGTTIWVSAGGQMDYYRYTNHRADYAHPVSTLAGAEPLVVRGVFEQVPPAGRAVARIPAGERHVLLAFTLPKSSDPAAEYAVPVGDYDNGSYTFLTDEIFFYDDPHVLYKHWGADVWAHVDKHEVVPGMSENQAMLSLGQVIVPHGDSIGNRRVTYDNNGNPVSVTFVADKATKITPGE